MYAVVVFKNYEGRKGDTKLPGPSFVEYIYNNNPIILCQITRKNNTHTSFVLPTSIQVILITLLLFLKKDYLIIVMNIKSHKKKPCLKKQKQL